MLLGGGWLKKGMTCVWGIRYICLNIQVYIYIHMYTYVYKERQRDRERERGRERGRARALDRWTVLDDLSLALYSLCLFGSELYKHYERWMSFLGRSQSSDNMDRWKCRGGKSNRRVIEEKGRRRIREEKMQAHEKVEVASYCGKWLQKVEK